MSRKFKILNALLLLCGLVWALMAQAWLLTTNSAGLSGKQAPEVGKLLLAMPTQQDPHFRGTVLLLLRYSPTGGAVGLIINRPTHVTLENQFDDRVSRRSRNNLLYWGGPVAMNRRVMLVEQPVAGGSSQYRPLLLERLYLADDPQQFERLLAQDAPGPRFRIYAGYTGWRAQQLEREIARGDWLVVSGTADLVMQSDAAVIWPQLINYRHLLMATLGLSVAQIDAPEIDVEL